MNKNLSNLNSWWKTKLGITFTTYTRKYHSGELKDAVPPHVIKATWLAAIASVKKPVKK